MNRVYGLMGVGYGGCALPVPNGAPGTTPVVAADGAIGWRAAPPAPVSLVALRVVEGALTVTVNEVSAALPGVWVEDVFGVTLGWWVG